MARLNASLEPGQMPVEDKKPGHLRLVEKTAATEKEKQARLKERDKPEAAEEVDDLWDNVPI